MTNTPGSRWSVEALDSSHDPTSFTCGKPVLDEWLRRIAGQSERRGLARTYVAVEQRQRRVCGFYSISAHHVARGVLPSEQAKGLPRMDVPVVLLGRLAVDRASQHQGLGKYLLLDALRRIGHVSRQIGVRAVEVHAIDDSARRFYRKYGFVSLHDDQNHLYLPMQVVQKLRLPPLIDEPSP
jgi:GNAT superfamily N-acetyltransferase